MIYTFVPFPLPARLFNRKCPKRCKKEPKNRVISISIFAGPSFLRPRGSRETTQKPPRSALRGPRAAREASRAAFGGLRASFGSLRGLFPMILVYFRWPQPVDSATNRTVPICPQSQVSVLFCYLTSPALDRSAPNRGSPGGGGESPQASSIYIKLAIRRPLAGV